MNKVFIFLVILIFVIINTYALLGRVQLVIELSVLNNDITFNSRIGFVFGLAKLRIYTFKSGVTNKKSKKKKKNRTKQKRELKVKKIIGLVIDERKRVLLNQFNLSGTIGVEDAYYTAMIIGICQSMPNVLLPLIFNNLLKQPQINFTPDFNKKIIKLDLFCIVSLKFTHIIKVLIKFLLIKYKNN